MTPTIRIKSRSDISPAIVTTAIGVLLAVIGAVLIGVNTFDKVPSALSDTTRSVAKVDHTYLYKKSRIGARRLLLLAHGHKYNLRALAADVERVDRQVSVGDTVVIYSTPIVGGQSRIWQLESKGSILQPFAPMRDYAAAVSKRAVKNGKRATFIGIVIACIGSYRLVTRRKARATVTISRGV